MEKTFADGGKIVKFVKVFSLESFPLYGNNIIIITMQGRVGGFTLWAFQSNVVLVICIGKCYCNNDDIENV